MKIAAVSVFVGVLASFVCDSNAQFGVGGPGFGWAIGQQASMSGVSIAIEAALAKANPVDFPPELQASFNLKKAIGILTINFLFSIPYRRNFRKFWQTPDQT